MSTRAGICLEKCKGIGFYQHNDGYPTGFLKDFILSVKKTGNIYFSNIENRISNYIAYTTMDKVDNAINRFNDNINEVLEDKYYYHSRIQIEMDLNYRNFTEFDIEYFYHFIEDEIRVYHVPILEDDYTFIGSISYEDINNKSTDDLLKMVEQMERD